MDAEPMQVIVISDYVCPWCYIGLQRAKQLEQEYELEFLWWPFELHPDTPKDGMSMEEFIGNRPKDTYAQQRQMLEEYAASAGVTLAPGRVLANSHKALELSEHAREEGHFEQMHEALFRAYFSDGRDIGQMDVLLDVAAECGLDVASTREVLESGVYSGLIDQLTAEARQNGYGSTPTMIFGGKSYVPGAQEMEVYRSVLDGLGVPKRAAS